MCIVHTITEGLWPDQSTRTVSDIPHVSISISPGGWLLEDLELINVLLFFV